MTSKIVQFYFDHVVKTLTCKARGVDTVSYAMTLSNHNSGRLLRTRPLKTRHFRQDTHDYCTKNFINIIGKPQGAYSNKIIIHVMTPCDWALNVFCLCLVSSLCLSCECFWRHPVKSTKHSDEGRRTDYSSITTVSHDVQHWNPLFFMAALRIKVIDYSI